MRYEFGGGHELMRSSNESAIRVAATSPAAAPSFVASTAAGTLWLTLGSEWTFLFSAMIASLAIFLLLSKRISL